MNAISNYFFFTEIKGECISPFEKYGNKLLSPLRYLGNGKKVDLIQEHEFVDDKTSPLKTAVQMDLSCPSDKPSWKTALKMMLLVIPGTILGACLKLIGIYKRPLGHEITNLIKDCLRQNQPGEISGTPSSFVGLVQDSIQFFKKELKIDTKKVLFFSEIKELTLCEVKLNDGDWSSTDIGRNVKILNDVNLLWNLTLLDVKNHFEEQFSSTPRYVKPFLISINPYIKGHCKAREFFATR